MFLKEVCPLKIGREALNHSQVKACRKPSSRADSHNRPNDKMHSSRKKRPVKIPCAGWKSPPNFALNPNWCVAAGEESEEADTQKQRESRVLEAFYPRLSSIPPNPSVSPDAKNGYLDDSCIPLIPLNPIEEEEAAYKEEPSQTTIELHAQDLLRGIESEHVLSLPCDLPISVEAPSSEKSGADADAAAAAAAAYTAIMKCKEQGSLIDSDLLISILTSPELMKLAVSELPATVQKQVTSSTPNGKPKEYGDARLASTNAGAVPVSASPQVPFSVPLPDSSMNTALRTSAVAPAFSVSVQVPRSNSVTPLVPLPVAKTKLGNGKPVEELGACAHTEMMPISGAVAETSCIVGDETKSIEMRISNNEISEPSSITSGTLSEAKAVTREMTDEHPIPAGGGVSLYSWTPSVPYQMSKATELLINNLLKESRGGTVTGIAQSAVEKPVTPSAPLLTSKLDVLECKRLISQYGDDKRGKSVLESDSRAPSIPVSTLKTETGEVPRPDASQSSLHLTANSPNTPHKAPSVAPSASSTPVKDVKYFKGLKEKHGDGPETVKIDCVEVCKSRNYLQGPLTSIEQTPKSDKPPCMFFNTPRGCRNGLNCRFQHIAGNASNPGEFSSEAPDSKRMKLSGEFGTKR